MMDDMIAHRASGVRADRDLYEHHLMRHFEHLVNNKGLAASEDPTTSEESATSAELATSEELSSSSKCC